MRVKMRCFCWLFFLIFLWCLSPGPGLAASKPVAECYLEELQRLGWVEDGFIYRPRQNVGAKDFYRTLAHYLEDELTCLRSKDRWEDFRLEDLSVKYRFKAREYTTTEILRRDAAMALAEVFYIPPETDLDEILEEKIISSLYSDDELLTDDERLKLCFLRQEKIMQGDQEGTFRPKEALSQKEFVELFYHLRYQKLPVGTKIELAHILQEDLMMRAWPDQYESLRKTLEGTTIYRVDEYPCPCGRIQLWGPPLLIKSSIGRPWIVLRGRYPRQMSKAMSIMLICDKGRCLRLRSHGEIFYQSLGQDTVFYPLMDNANDWSYADLKYEGIEGILIHDENFNQALYTSLVGDL